MSKKLYDKIMTILMWSGVFLFLCALSTLGLTRSIHGAMAHDIFATGVKAILLMYICHSSKDLNSRRWPFVATIYLLCRFSSFALTESSQKLGIHNVLMVLADVFARPFIWLAWKLGYPTALSAVIGARGFTSAWWTFTLIADFIFFVAMIMFLIRNKIIVIGHPISNKLALKMGVSDSEDPTDDFLQNVQYLLALKRKIKNGFSRQES